MEAHGDGADLKRLFGNAETVAQLRRDQLVPAVAHVGGLAMALAARIAEEGIPSSPPSAQNERLLDVREAAAKLGMSPSRLYKQTDQMPFTVREGRSLRFSALGIDRYIRQRQRGM